MAGGVKGLDKLMKKYSSLSGSVTGSGLEKAMGASIKMVQGEAKLLCPSNDGELRQSIKTSVELREDKVIGTAYTNKKHGTYVEFGTGPVGEVEHAGISPEVSQPIHNHPGGSMKARLIKKRRRSITSSPLILRMDGFIRHLDRRPNRSCIQH